MIDAVAVSVESLNNIKNIQKYVIKGVSPRLYQETILASCASSNCLVVLPTGMGKTMIALMLAAQRFKQYPNSKMVFLAPTKPLVEQHLQTFRKHFEIDDNELAVFTGMVRPEKRKEMWDSAKVIFSTPQGLENDIISERLSLENVSTMVFDEAHRAVGEYSYVFISKQYMKKARFPRILALTASPGSDIDKILEVCANLHIEEVEIRTDNDTDVKPYVQQTDIEWVKVSLPEEFLSVKKYLEQSFRSKLVELKQYGAVQSYSIGNFGKRDVLALQGSLQAKIAQGEKDFEILKSMSLAAEALKVQHALELIETQGAESLKKYFERLVSDARTTKVKAVQNLMKDINFKSAMIKTDSLLDKGIEHPKLKKLRGIINEQLKNDNKSKIIVFTQYRDTASRIKHELSEEKILSEVFVGQAKKGETGLSQKKQVEMLQMFRDGMFNVLIATSVAEEGLDIPKVDYVLFYEPIPSAIRHIQRRGRTGRQGKGSVKIMFAENTRDVGYRWSAFYKEKRMYRNLEQLKSTLKLKEQNQVQKSLGSYSEPEKKTMIFTDYREKGSPVVKELIESTNSVRLEKLEAGDFLLSSRVCIEYKTVSDFVNSIVDCRLLQQAKELKSRFERPIVIVEGDDDIYSVRNVHPNSIRGMIATITVSYGIPIIFTKTPKETASIISIIAKREQEDKSRDFSIHSDKRMFSAKEQQEYIISSFPGVGPAIAKELLKNMGSIKAIVNAEEKEITKVEKVGHKIAKNIKEISEKSYDDAGSSD